MLASDVAPPARIDAELAEIARKALERSDQPLSASQLRGQLSGPFRRRAAGLQPVLDGLVEQGQVFRLPKYRGAHRYWTRDLESYARQTIVQALSGRSLTWSELKAKSKARLGGLSEPKQKAILDELVREGQVRELPAYVGSRTKRFTSAAVDPSEYVADALQKVATALAKVGILRGEVLAAAGRLVDRQEQRSPGLNEPREASTVAPDALQNEGGTSLEHLFLERMVELEPAARQGAMVDVPELRRALDFQPMNARDFDQAVWELVRQGRLAVHRHGHPAALDPAERAALVTDERGNYYHGVSLRTE